MPLLFFLDAKLLEFAQQQLRLLYPVHRRDVDNRVADLGLVLKAYKNKTKIRVR